MIKETIESNALALLCAYGLKEENVKKNPEALDTFIKVLEEEIANFIKEY